MEFTFVDRGQSKLCGGDEFGLCLELVYDRVRVQKLIRSTFKIKLAFRFRSSLYNQISQFRSSHTLNISPTKQITVRFLKHHVSAHHVKSKASVNRPPTPDVLEDTPEREPTLQELINIKLIETGEKERLMELLRERLVDCGWKDEMKSLCRAFVKKKGRNNVTVDELIHVITPKGRASVPDSVKAELLQRIRTFLGSAAL
ncbi:hypothetical protein Lal_00012605 [Lupinus albus]|nr:hypothetical protein Lal_00012605 [Lupinus albus]